MSGGGEGVGKGERVGDNNFANFARLADARAAEASLQIWAALIGWSAWEQHWLDLALITAVAHHLDWLYTSSSVW